MFDGGETASYERTKVRGKTIVGTNEHFLLANQYTIAYGRNLTAEDVDLGRAVTVVGVEIQKKLFPNQSPVGSQTIWRASRVSGSRGAV